MDPSHWIAAALAVALLAGAAVAWRVVRRLRADRERLRLVLRESPDPFSLSRLDTGVLVAVNEGFLRLHGLREAEVLGRAATSLGLWKDPAERAALVAAVARGERVRDRDVHLVDRTGADRILSMTAAPLVIDGVPHMAAYGRDVTASRAAEAARDGLADDLRRSEERARTVLRNVPLVQWALDPQGVFTVSEGRGLAAFGLKPGEVVGRRIEDVYRDHPAVVADFRRALAGETFVAPNDFGPVVFESHWSPLRDAAGAVVGVTGIALDITARRAAEVARRESEAKLKSLERLAAMGRAAAALAHEVNNPLTYVLGNLDAVLEHRPPPEPEVRALVAEARAGADRIRQIVGDLRVFAQARPDARPDSDVTAVLRSAVAFTQNEVRHRARLDTEVTVTRRVAMPDGRLAQVLVNLLANAAQALPEGNAAEHLVQVTARDAGARVIIEVRDTGAGMPPDVKARVFEPFFTTRADRGGMGMGLALTRAWIQEAGGTIDVESAPGRGSTFRIALPVAEAAAEPSSPPAAAAPGAIAPAPRTRVLVIDDEPLVARAVARLLPAHDVEVETSARSALVRLQRGDRFDAVVCDLMMPDLAGMDLFDALEAERPAAAARMIFLTGGAFTDRARAFVERTTCPVLEKPVEPAALRQVVAEVAGAARPLPVAS